MNKTTGIILGVVVIVVVVGALVMLKGGSSQPVATDTPLASAAPTDANGGAFVQQAPSTSPAGFGADVTGSTSGSVAPTTGATVSITDTGFDPSTLTVPAGTTVTFTNNGSGPHWPASNPHPTHTDLPGFDAKHGLATGESYTFTFTKVGSWGFHDHMNPSWHGTIVVQ